MYVYFEILKRMNFNQLDEKTILHGYIKHNGISYEILKKIVTGFLKKKPNFKLEYTNSMCCKTKNKSVQHILPFKYKIKYRENKAMKRTSSRDFYLIEIVIGHI